MHAVVLAKAHNSALAELLFNLRQRSLQRFALVFGLDVLHFFAYGLLFSFAMVISSLLLKFGLWFLMDCVSVERG